MPGLFRKRYLFEGKQDSKGLKTGLNTLSVRKKKTGNWWLARKAKVFIFESTWRYKIRVAIQVIVFLVVSLAFISIFAVALDIAPVLRIPPGVSEGHVIARLGFPDIRYQNENAPKAYYVKGYSRRERAITGKVFIYFGQKSGMVVSYVYIDARGKYESMFIGWKQGLFGGSKKRRI